MWRWGKLEIGWGFPVLAALAMLAGAGEVLPLTLAFALCHELGHVAALRLAGAEVERLRLTAFGAEIRTLGGCPTPGKFYALLQDRRSICCWPWPLRGWGAAM